MEIHSRNKNPNQVFSGFARRRQPILKTQCPHQTPLRPTRSIDAMVVMEIKYDIPWLKKGDDFLMTFCVLAIHFPSFSISSLRFPIVFFFLFIEAAVLPSSLVFKVSIVFFLLVVCKCFLNYHH